MTSDQRRVRAFTLAAALALFNAQAALAHVTLSQTRAPAGAPYTAFFRIGHGCAGSATTALRVEIPEGLSGVKPQPKPGWSLRIDHAPLARPVRGEGGRMLTERVSALTWTGGPLPDDQWDEFGVSARLPSTPGVLYFPAVQTCGRGEVRWTDLPVPGAPQPSGAHPAPVLTLGPPQPGEAMGGMNMGG